MDNNIQHAPNQRKSVLLVISQSQRALQNLYAKIGEFIDYQNTYF